MSCNKAFAVLHILIICSATHLKERFERKHTHAICVTKRFNGEVILLIKEYTLRKRVIGQNGMDKMVRTKCYGQKGIGLRTKWYRTKWYRQNGTGKILRIQSSINPALIDNIIFSSIPLPRL